MKSCTRKKHRRYKARVAELRDDRDGYPLRGDRVIDRAPTDPMAAQMVNGVRVTDHAVLRYLQRVHNVDIRAVRERMIAGADVALMLHFKSGKFPADECRLVLQDAVVVTVHGKDEGET